MNQREIIEVSPNDAAPRTTTIRVRNDHRTNAHHGHHNDPMVHFPHCHEWNYFCEGGRHVVFSYTGTDTRWWNTLLRLDKAIWRNVEMHHQHTSSPQQQQQQHAVMVTLDSDFYRNRIYQILHPYVDIPYMIRPDGAPGAMDTTDDTPYTHPQHHHWMWDTYLASLRHQAVPYIPPRRRSDWYPSTDRSSSSTTTTTVATTFFDTMTRVLVLPDYRWLHDVPVTTGGTTTVTKHCHCGTTTSICIEMKPKCGVTPVSPFTQSRRRNKYFTSRFVLQQTLYQTRQLTKDWMQVERGPHESNGSGSGSGHCHESTVSAATTAKSSSFEKSHYDPLDLFSQHPERIRRAMRHLVTRPQNNFKIWHRNQLIWGHGWGTGHSTPNDNPNHHNHHEAPLDWRRLGESIGISLPTMDDPTTAVLEFVVAATTTILATEDFLPRLLSYQKLDLLDTDGAMAVYQRLLELCDHESTVVDSILDAPVEWAETADATTRIPSLLSDCPIRLPKMHSNIVQLCAQVDAMASIFSVPLSHSETDMTHRNERIDDISRRAHTVVDALSIEECCYLLQSWLFSLSMCDLTFFINLNVVPTNDDPKRGGGQEHDSTNCHSDSSGFRVRSLQSNRHINNNSSSNNDDDDDDDDDDTPGCLEYRNHITNEYQRIHYQIKVIDIDRKPAKKIQSRYAKERQFDNV